MINYIYLDNCATTKPYDEVIEVVIRMLREDFGNPSSLHSMGLHAKEILTTSRRTVADALGAEPEEIYFTSGGTESNNLALLSVCSAVKNNPKQVVSTTVEHAAVTKTLRHLRRDLSWSTEFIPIRDNTLDLNIAKELIGTNTTLTTAMLVNNETGMIFPIKKLKGIIEANGSPSLLHCDAVQAFGKVPFTVDSLGADLVSISGHKIRGPKGVGALYIRGNTPVERCVFGGGQENGFRSGTEPMPAIAGFAEAIRIMFASIKRDIRHMNSLKLYCTEKLRIAFPNILISSPVDGAPHVISFSIPHLRNAEAVKHLSESGIYISSAAACKSNRSRGPSVLMSFGLTAEESNSSLRVGLCGSNSAEDINAMIAVLSRYVKSTAEDF